MDEKVLVEKMLIAVLNSSESSTKMEEIMSGIYSFLVEYGEYDTFIEDYK